MTTFQSVVKVDQSSDGTHQKRSLDEDEKDTKHLNRNMGRINTPIYGKELNYHS